MPQPIGHLSPGDDIGIGVRLGLVLGVRVARELMMLGLVLLGL